MLKFKEIHPKVILRDRECLKVFIYSNQLLKFGLKKNLSKKFVLDFFSLLFQSLKLFETSPNIREKEKRVPLRIHKIKNK